MVSSISFNREQARYYLAAIIDGEGSVTKAGASSKSVRISNTEESILDAIRYSLNLLNIRYKEYGEKRASNRLPITIIAIYSWTELSKINDLPLQSQAKKDRLKALLSNIKYKGYKGNKTSSYRGVDFYRNRWRARGTLNGKSMHIGTFGTEHEAAVAIHKWRTENKVT